MADVSVLVWLGVGWLVMSLPVALLLGRLLRACRHQQTTPVPDRDVEEVK